MASLHIQHYIYMTKLKFIKRKTSRREGSIKSESIVKTIYDELGRVIGRIDGCDKIIEKIIYDQNSRQKYSYDAYNKKTEYVYDENDRLINTIDPRSHFSKQSYDYAGNVRTTTDGKGNITTYIYDEYDRLWYVINAEGNKTRYTYDRNGNMLTQEILSTNEQNIDTVFTSTTYEYNAGNLVTKKIDFGGRTTSSDGSHQYNYKRVESYKYYPNGDLREKTDRSNSETIQNGAVTTYEYDIHGRLRNQTTEQTGKDDSKYNK